MGIWKDKKRKHWCYSFKFQNRVYAARGFKTKTDARSAREERRAIIKKQKEYSGATPLQMGLIEAALLYLDYAEKAFAKKTYKYKIYVLKNFAAYLDIDLNKDRPINHITTYEIQQYLNTRHSNNNYNVHRKDLMAFFQYARKVLKVIPQNPVAEIGKLPSNPKPKIIPSEEQILKLIMAADPETERPLLLTLLHTAARIDEILRLTWQDVNFSSKTLTRYTRKRKGGVYEPITIPMNRDLFEVMKKKWETREQDHWVFYNKKTDNRYMNRPKMMKSLCKKAGIDPPFGFHTIRHFMASYLADNEKVSKKSIQSLLGHKSLTTTEIYLHSIDGSLRGAMKTVEGKFNVDAGTTEKLASLQRRPGPDSLIKNEGP